MLVFLLLKKVFSASSYGHFTEAKEFWSQCHILYAPRARRPIYTLRISTLLALSLRAPPAPCECSHPGWDPTPRRNTNTQPWVTILSAQKAPAGRPSVIPKAKYMTLGPKSFCFSKMTITRRRKHLFQK